MRHMGKYFEEIQVALKRFINDVRTMHFLTSLHSSSIFVAQIVRGVFHNRQETLKLFFVVHPVRSVHPSYCSIIHTLTVEILCLAPNQYCANLASRSSVLCIREFRSRRSHASAMQVPVLLPDWLSYHRIPLSGSAS